MPIPRPARPRRLTLFIAALAAALTLGLSACVSPPPEASSGGGTAVIAFIQEPGLMSPMFGTQSGRDLTYAFVVEPLFETMADGTMEPLLAAELPTTENGGLSADGRTVTFRLRPGITWSDGTPLTAQDMAFTVEVTQNRDGAALNAEPEYQSIASTQVVDDRTLVVTMKEPQPGYLNLFRQILPKHAFSSSAVQLEDPQARLPLGTGPFKYEEWKPGDQIRLVRNPAYWRDPALPKLDGITLKITPEKQAAISGFINGEYDAVYFITSGDLADLQRAKDSGAPIELKTAERTGNTEWLWLNHSAGGDLSKPHPVLGDPAIREAIDVGINRKAIIDDVLGGFGRLNGAMLFSGFGAVPAPPAAFDTGRANAVLDAAGWARGADGIRSRDGVRAHLRFQTIAGDQTRALYQQIIQQNMKDVGIELSIENVPSNTIFDSRGKNGLLATGNFDIVMSRDGAFADPSVWVEVFTTRRIPTDANPSTFSYTHWSDKRFDDLERKQATEIDPATRKQALAQINDLFHAERVAIPVYGSVLGDAWNTALTDVDTGFWDGMWTTSSSARWAIAR
ncbi:peptide ABC transporter substrate-binding protein [Pseudonocardia sp. TRM90224]|uniref:peptide ABC transporter substrate-binding protein n=1 Tax=Pseudonocardia sp. TRM90224 TaxID=2812678 RepID=UPI001E5624B0|nr:peptide ABC transporter substrate-binding protein [Pseudonocardia sp. TRM90224]